MDESSKSPIPQQTRMLKVQKSFSYAIEAIIAGRRVRREEWENEDEYCLLKDEYLMIHRDDKFHAFIVREVDLLATDWVVIREA